MVLTFQTELAERIIALPNQKDYSRLSVIVQSVCNVIKQHKLYKEIEDLEQQKAYYLSQIEKDSIEYYHLNNTKKEQERLAEKERKRQEKEKIKESLYFLERYIPFKN